MRKVYIDLSRLKNNYFLGYCGEHNMTEIEITINQELAEADSFSLKFSVCGTSKIITNLTAANNKISYVLPQDITGILDKKCQCLVQVIAYLDGVIIGKSELIECYFDDAISEKTTEIDENIISLESEILLNTANRHNHENKEVIDKFSFDEKLLYDGEPISVDIDLSEYAKKTDIPTEVSAFENDKGYLTEHQSLEGYAKLTDLPTVPTNVSAFENDIGYLTEHQSLADYRTAAAQDEIDNEIVKTADKALEKTYEIKDEVDSEIASTIARTEEIIGRALEKIDEIEVPTKVSELVNDAGYLTEHQSLANYATKSEVTTGLALKADKTQLAAYALKTELPTVPTVVSAFENDAGYLTQHQSLEGLATDEDIANVMAVAEGKTATYIFDTVAALDAWLDTEPEGLKSGDVFLIRATDVPDYWYDADNNTKQIMETTKVDLTDYATKTFVNNGLAAKANTSDLALVATTGNYQSLSNKPTKLSDFIDNMGYVDEIALDDRLANYALYYQLPTKTSELTNDSGFLTQHQSLAAYALKTDIPSNVSAFTNDAGYLTQHQSLAEYAKKSELPTVPTMVSAFTNDAGYLTSHQSLAAYALKTEIPIVPTKVSAFTNDAGYLTQHQSLANYALKSEIPTVPTNISAFTNDAGYLTQHQSLSDYIKKDDAVEKNASSQQTISISSGTNDTPMFIKSRANGCYLGFKNSSDTIIGYYGVNSNNKPVFYYSGGDKEIAIQNQCNANTVDNYHVAKVSSLPSSPEQNTIYFIV